MTLNVLIMDFDDGSFGMGDLDPPPSPPQQVGPSRGKGGRKGGGRGKSTTADGAAVGAACGKGECFLPDCKKKKKANSKFCGTHHPMAESAHYQAKNSTEEQAMDTYKTIFNDAYKCQVFLDDWQKSNPPGVWSKKLVDWGCWKKEVALNKHSSMLTPRICMT